MSSGEAWQQEKEFLDYMFISLHGGSGAANASGEDNGSELSGIGRTRRSGQSVSSNAATAVGAVAGTATVTKSPVKTEAPAGLDHLDNLCKLMEQLGELRDANSRLQKRVQYLEDMKTLQEMHQELDLFVGSDPVASADKAQDAGADRSLDSLDSGEILQPIDIHPNNPVKGANSNEAIEIGRSVPGKKVKSGNHHMKFKKPALLKYRERSKSVGFDESIPIGENQIDFNNAGSTATTPSPENYNKMNDNRAITDAGCRRGGRTTTSTIRTKTKVSKWTRVKEAFRWEKAHVDTSANHPAVKVTSTVGAKHPDKEAEPLRQLEVASTQTLSPDNLAGHVTAMAKSPSPIFRLGRRRRSTTSRTSSTSSSSLSECPLESEILKSFADAQELPLFRLEKRPSSPEVKLAIPAMRDEETTSAARLDDLQRASLLSLPQMKRLHRQSTVSCDGNFATCSPTVSPGEPHMPDRIPEGAISPDIPATDSAAAASASADPFLSRIKGPESPNRRKISKNSSGHSLVPADHNQELISATLTADNDESGSFISNLRSQLKPINEWTSKWHCDIMKNTNPLASVGSVAGHAETNSRNSLSVPSTPNQHQAFTFDEFPEAAVEMNTTSRENSPGSKKNQDSPVESGSVMTPLNSTAIKNNPGLLLNTISPEFRKKVEVWERLKSGLSTNSSEGAVFSITPPTPTTPNIYGKKSVDSPDWNDIGKRRSEPDKLPPAFKKKLAEWEIRKAVAGKSDQNVEELHKILPHDFNRKLQEWERMKQQQAAAAAVAGKVSVVGSQSGLERQGSGKHHQQQQQRGKLVKSAHKTEEAGQQRGEKQKEKDLQWLEKELQKIEREKLRLEREREKYIERESRLEKIRDAMKQPGHGPQREICIRTSTGEFRFQGLSRKFTKKLFQWEEQKGIRPEASTIALLDGAFNPNGRSGHCHHLHHHHPSTGEFSSSITTRPTSLSAMTRSKSESSVADLVSTSVHSQPSSLSLNDAETTTDFDRRLNDDEAAQLSPGPGALLVEVEDVTEESAAIVDIPDVQPQAPIYSIAPAELRQTIQSEHEDQPRYQIGITSPAHIQRNDSIRTEASLKLMEENLSLLDRLRAKGEIVKYLELQMTSIDGDMAGVVNTQSEEMVRLKEEETCLSDQEESTATGNSSTIDRLKKRIVLLENRGQQLKSEKEHLHAVYQRQCTQQANLVQHLVDKMQQLRDIGSSVRAPLPPFDPEALERLDTLTSEILHEAQTLEHSIRHPQKIAVPSVDPGTDLETRRSSALNFPEKLSIKANQLKEEYERLRSLDSDREENSDNETTPSPVAVLPELPPVPAEMSAAAQKKVFVETHRLVFAPFEEIRAEETASGSDAPWRRNRSPKDSTSADSAPWRKNSLTASTTEEAAAPDSSRPTTATTVRNTAPNIRRMIDKYHQRVTGSTKERCNSTTPVTQFRPKCEFTIEEHSASPTPPPSIVSENKIPIPSMLTESDDIPLPPSQQGQLFPIQLSKSLSTGAMSESKENQRADASNNSSMANWNREGVLRSKSGHQIPVANPCARNPSFFRKSPLDPSIDDLLQKYRGRRQVDVPAELPKSPTTNPERMLKLKQAREAFLTIGPGAIRDHNKISQSEMDLIEESVPIDDDLEHQHQQQPPSTPTSSGPVLVVQDIGFDACADDSESCRSQEGSTKSSVWPGSVPSSPAALRRSKPEIPHPLSRHSWLKQPTRFFFPKPKTP